MRLPPPDSPRTDQLFPYTTLFRSTDAGVNKATRRLFADVYTPAKMIALGEAGLKQHIKTIGLFNTKAKNVIALSKALIADHDGKVPADRDALEKLPGVGRKTANVVMNVAFDQETFAVRSEEHTSELQSLMRSSYAVFCL